MADDPSTPELEALGGEGQSVPKIDLLLGYVRGLVGQGRQVLARLEKGDRKLEDHGRRIEALERKVGRKTKPEPHWLWRAFAIAAVSAGGTAVVHWLLKGGLAAGVGG